VDGWATGLRYKDGTPKPSLDGFRLPIWAERAVTDSGSPGVFVFGQVRPGGEPQGVELEAQAPDGSWTPVASLPLRGQEDACSSFPTGPDGIFTRFVPDVR
jgi:hypothetical protein